MDKKDSYYASVFVNKSCMKYNKFVEKEERKNETSNLVLLGSYLLWTEGGQSIL